MSINAECNEMYKILKSTERICFIGDSITIGSASGGYGWYDGLLAKFPNIESVDVAATGGQTSARNRLVGLVTKVTSDRVMSQVEMQCGPFRIVSLMSTEAVGDLGLEPGVVAVAVVKATTVIVEAAN